MNPPTNATARALSGLVAAKEIQTRGNFSKTHLFNMLKRREFPPPALRVGPRFTRWTSADVDAWFADPAAWIAAHAKSEAA